MIRSEFAEWGKYHQSLFPDFSAWWDGLEVNSKRAIVSQWQQMLSKCTLADCKEASNRMLAGTVELCPAYERSMLASRIAQAAREIASERLPKRPEANHRYRPSQPGEGPTAGEIFAAAVKAAERGEDPVQVAREMLPPVPLDKQPRYRCRSCQDTGLVHVWSNRSIRSALAGELRPQDRRTMTVACECQAADGMCLGDDDRAPKGWHGWRQSARYSPDRYCRCSGSVDDPERIAELEEWVQDYRDRMTRQMGNYSP